MSENLHNIDKLFKNAIEDHEDLPSNVVWNNIDKGLDKNKVVSIQRKYYVLKRLAVAVFIVGFVASVFAIYYNSRFYNTQATYNNSINDQASDNMNVKGSQKLKNNSVNNINTDKENQSSLSSDQNASNSPKSTTTITSSSSSNSSDAALTSENYNKINKESSTSSSPPFVNAERKNKVNLIYNKNNLNLSRSNKNDITSVTKNTRKITSASNQSETNNIADQSQKRIRESIAKDHLIYSFQPSFSKSFNHSNVALAIATPISKLKKLPRIAVTVFAGPEKNIAHFKDPPEPMRPGSRDEFRHSEQSKSSFRTGILFDYPFSSNWSIGSGIIYSSTVTSIAPKVVFAKQDDRGNINYEFNCSAGYAYIPAKTGSAPLIGDSAKVFNSKTHISYISIPVTAGYNLSAGKFILKPSGGFLLNFLSTGKVQSEISSSSMNAMNSTNSISGLKSNYLSGEINLTAIYRVSNKIGISITPGTQFALTSINKNTSVKTYPGYVGITGGIRVAF